MKTLSIKQPWASLIAHGIKDIENRTWKTNFRGKIYIHASGKYQSNLDSMLTPEQSKIVKDFYTHWNSSAIIGEVEIIDCVINHPSIWAEKSLTEPNPHQSKYYKDYELWKNSKPIYNWVLDNPVLYEKPILNIKGKLSFWEFNPDELKNS